MSQIATETAIQSWFDHVKPESSKERIQNLESGKVLYFPNLSYELGNDQHILCNSHCLSPRVKNISYDSTSRTLKGVDLDFQHFNILKDLMQDFSEKATHLMNELFPQYHRQLIVGRTSFRPAEIEGRKNSYRKDDTRLHVDAFPATPTRGHRILRVFSNVNPHDKPRIWHLGEPLDEVIDQFIPKIKKPIPLAHELMHRLHLTKHKRTEYDHYMLRLHNSMKKNSAYQNKAIKERIEFPSQTSWVVFTDCVSHAALSGQHALEQTFYLPVDAQLFPEKSPLLKLQRFLKRDLLN